MRIAIVGSGISGLGTAWYLAKFNAEIHVFEASDVLGGHSATLEVPANDRRKSVKVAVNPAYDLLSPQTYPRFSSLLKQLGAPTEPREFSYTFEAESKKDPRTVDWSVRMPTLLNARNLGQLASTSYRDFVATALRVGKACARIATSPSANMTWGDLLRRAEVPDTLRTLFFLPAFARPWGVKPSEVESMPAAIVGTWVAEHRVLTARPAPWEWNVGGAQSYVRPLVETLTKRGVIFHRKTAIRSVHRVSSGLRVLTEAGHSSEFAHVVMATNARQALALLAEPSKDVAHALGTFRYQRNTVLVHGDERLLPKDKNDWSYFNVRYSRNLDETYNSIWFGKAAEVPVFATNHRVLPFPLEESKTFGRFAFEQPIFTLETERARGELARAQGRRGIWFAGVYAHGTGHHEDGLVMASRVAAGIRDSVSRERPKSADPYDSLLPPAGSREMFAVQVPNAFLPTDMVRPNTRGSEPAKRNSVRLNAIGGDARPTAAKPRPSEAPRQRATVRMEAVRPEAPPRQRVTVRMEAVRPEAPASKRSVRPKASTPEAPETRESRRPKEPPSETPKQRRSLAPAANDGERRRSVRPRAELDREES